MRQTLKQLAQKPLQYQKGWTEFYKLKFKLTPDVLIPRPETELLIDEVLKFFSRYTTYDIPYTILDIGTGSGCIAISIAKNLKDAKIIAVDISKNALKVAEANARFHKVDKRVIFLESDLLSFIPANTKKQLDVIVTNLPYIPTQRLMYIDPMVTDWEPRIALDGGTDGFELYRKLFTQMKEKNIIPKLFLGEIDEEQGAIALQSAKRFFPNVKKIEIKKDLTGRDRFLLILF